MKCCDRQLTSVELEVAGQPYAMYRCNDCDSTHWARGGEAVPFAEVAGAMQEATATRAREADAKRARLHPFGP